MMGVPFWLLVGGSCCWSCGNDDSCCSCSCCSSSSLTGPWSLEGREDGGQHVYHCNIVVVELGLLSALTSSFVTPGTGFPTYPSAHGNWMPLPLLLVIVSSPIADVVVESIMGVCLVVDDDDGDRSESLVVVAVVDASEITPSDQQV